MRALVTGAAGFVGRHMTRALEARDWYVRRCDITAGCDALRVFRESQQRWDLVVHCAAAEPHRAGIDAGPMNLATNLMLDAAMFQWAVRTGTRVLYLSSSAAYPVDLQDDFATARELREDDIRLDARNIGRPADNYGLTKLTGEHLAAAASATGLPVHVVRTFSGYGEDQAECFPFRAFVERARRREDPFQIWGSADQVRDFVHIDDVIAGALAVVDNDERRAVNLCTGVGTSMQHLAELCCEVVGYSPEIKVDESAPLGVAYRVGDPARMNEHYTAKISIEDGVRRALAAS